MSRRKRRETATRLTPSEVKTKRRVISLIFIRRMSHYRTDIHVRPTPSARESNNEITEMSARRETSSRSRISGNSRPKSRPAFQRCCLARMLRGAPDIPSGNTAVSTAIWTQARGEKGVSFLSFPSFLLSRAHMALKNVGKASFLLLRRSPEMHRPRGIDCTV